MIIHRPILLYGAIAATFTATAQEMLERRTRSTTDVRREEKNTTVTIVTTADGTTNTRVLTGEEAALWLAEQSEGGEGDGEVYACVLPIAPEPVIGMPALCQVMLTVEPKEVVEPGEAKAEVFRYRYKQKTSAIPTHSVVSDTGDDAEKALTQSDGGPSQDNLRVLPNPSSGLFTLAFLLPDEGGSGELYITDAAGRVVHRETVMGSGGQARTLDLRNNGTGTYVATIVLGDNTISKRLVIE
ncbi:MAG: T9SS type A sorting domain-containing protein [Flavobacteriales bacterium]